MGSARARLVKRFRLIVRNGAIRQFCKRSDEQVISSFIRLTEKNPSIGFYQCYFRIHKDGFTDNHKLMYRIYSSMKLNIHRMAKKSLPKRIKQALYKPDAPNKVWSLDFMSDSLWDGRKFRTMNIIADFNRKILVIGINIRWSLFLDSNNSGINRCFKQGGVKTR